jgi:3-hydroxyacyl-CoA dehydrogenase
VAEERDRTDEPVTRFRLLEHGRVLPVYGGLDLDAAVSRADIVVEAVPEDLTLKKNVFARIDGLAPRGARALSASVALSAMSVHALGEWAQPRRCP